jgi:glycosyltransferase involved in cell wall biosynthesis
MRVLFIAGYQHTSHHRKLELLADAPDIELLHIAPPGGGRETGNYPSADGRRSYRVRVVPRPSLGQPDDPHRHFHWPGALALREFAPDLIHCEYEHESVMTLMVTLAHQMFAPRTPLVLYAWQNIVRPRAPWVRALSTVTARKASYFFCGSSEAVQVLRASGYLAGAEVAPMFGLDTRIFRPRSAADLRKRLGLNEFTVGYAGRLVPEKGVNVLLHGLARVGQPVQALVMGDGPLRAELQRLAAALGLAERCRFVGAVNHSAVPEYLSAADVLVLPSLTTKQWKEQFGRVLIEAMGCRVPVVASDSGAIPEVIGTAGRLFAEGDAEALAAILAELAADPRQRAALAECGYQRILSRYTIEVLAANLLTVWRRLQAAGPV